MCGVKAGIEFVVGHPLVAIMTTAMRASPIKIALLWRAPVLRRLWLASLKPSSRRKRRRILPLPKRRSLVRQFVTGDMLSRLNFRSEVFEPHSVMIRAVRPAVVVDGKLVRLSRLIEGTLDGPW
jgi:hypothetical protein